jgi:hypothetical protein
MENFGLSKMSGSNFASFMSDVFENFDEKITTYFTDYSWLKPHYELKENDGKYEITVKYDDVRDTVNVETDNEKHFLSINVYEDWKKTNGISSCNYYGRFAMTVPEDCDLDSVKKTIDKEKKEMVLSFRKVEKKGETDKMAVKNNQNNLNYKELYDKLLDKYNNKVQEFENKNMNLRKENEELAKKLNNIKNIFN